ncbi:MAG: hypothetical protein JNK12_05110 [Acidimicrobiales bacterium]|nr:hypothetical protein [Acidimicrobiales bacterium]
MSFAVKAAVGAPLSVGATLTLVEKAMYGGWKVAPDHQIFVFDSDHQGGAGLCARGVITSVEHAPEHRWKVQIRIEAQARRPLGRGELRPYRDLDDGSPEAEIARKLYRQATNKFVAVGEGETAFLTSYF